jgi:hypothetical protein
MPVTDAEFGKLKLWVIIGWIVLILVIVSCIFYRVRVYKWQSEVTRVHNELVDEHKATCDAVKALHSNATLNCPGDGAGKSPPPPKPYP